MKVNVGISEQEIQEILEENGVFYFPDADDSPVEMDSLTFVSLIVSLEERYSVDISSEYMREPPDTYRNLINFLIEAVHGESHNTENRNTQFTGDSKYKK